jgi:biopolymer transport protein TolR
MAAPVGGKGFVSEINVTPFVDVMLVLLIIFMVTAPMMTEGLDVDLPETREVKALPAEDANIVLTVRRDNTLYLDTYRVELAELETKVKLLVTDQKKQLFLQADKDVPYGLVVNVMGRLRAAGVEKLGVVALRETAIPDAGAASGRNRR